MAVDQPTNPNLGNLSDTQFRALPDWAVKAVNQAGKDDTFQSMEECAVALVYRLLLENMAYINLALGGQVDTPLLTLIQSLVDRKNWRETDWPALALGLSSLGGISPQPSALWTCDGKAADEINGVLDLNTGNTPGIIHYSVVSAQGSLGSEPDHPFVLGIRTHADRWVYVDDTPLARTQDVAYQASYSLPEWPQDNASPIVLAKVADFDSDVDTGPTNRIGFEFGLGTPGDNDGSGTPRDYSLYLKWYDSLDFENIAYAWGGPPIPSTPYPTPIYIGVTPGRRVTLGFHRYFDGLVWRVRFYVNGRMIADSAPDEGDAPSVGSSSDIRLHIGSAQLGKSYCGGPVNNAALWSDAGEATLDAAMLALYQRGEGFEAAP